jgi:hypothetical protein
MDLYIPLRPSVRTSQPVAFFSDKTFDTFSVWEEDVPALLRKCHRGTFAGSHSGPALMTPSELLFG